MPKIYLDENGNRVKEGSNGCTDCGLPGINKTVLDEPVEKSIVSNTKPKADEKAPTKEVNNDDD